MTLPIAFNNKHNENFSKNCFNTEGKRETYQCNICGKNYNRKANLTFHINSHNFNNYHSDGDFEKDSLNTCNICFKTFTIKKNLLKHLRAVHKNFSEAARMVVKKIKCPEKTCKFLCRMMRELREHIEKCHKVKILKDTLQFPSEAAFQKWKKEEESNTTSWFVTGRKKNTLSDGTKKQTLYCHRTGHYNPKGFGKYRMRSLGSCKIGVTCPAAMEVRESSDGGLTVIYYKTHLGHMQDVAYLKLSTEERSQLAEKIKQGFSFDAILDDVKESQHMGQEKKRIHLLSKKDLYSIMRTANNHSNKSTKREHNKEAIKENAPTKENKISEENVLLVENMQMGKVEENYNFNMCHSPSIIPTFKTDSEFEENPPDFVPQKNQKVININQTPQEIPSQIVILSSEINYTSVSEIILLSKSDSTLAQPVLLPQTKVPATENFSVQNTGSQTDVTNDVIVEEKYEFNKSNLQLQLKEKLQKISEVLPLSEHLTPKQYNLINAKLNGVLDIFNAAKIKADARKQTSKKVIKKNKILKNEKKSENETEYKVQESLELYQNPLVYAIYT